MLLLGWCVDQHTFILVPCSSRHDQQARHATHLHLFHAGIGARFTPVNTCVNDLSMMVTCTLHTFPQYLSALVSVQAIVYDGDMYTSHFPTVSVSMCVRTGHCLWWWHVHSTLSHSICQYLCRYGPLSMMVTCVLHTFPQHLSALVRRQTSSMLPHDF